MVFSSPIFLACFLPVLLGIYALAPSRARNAVLLAGSLFFYAWGEPKAVLLMLALIGVNHAAGLAIARRLPPDGARPPRGARLALALGVAADLAALGTFKYASFLAQNLQALGLAVPDPGIALPIGVSFYVFQCVSYLADVYRRAIPAERSLPDFALYVSLFPQLVAGPIVRYASIRGEMRDRTLRADDAAEGLRRFGRGLAKKVLVADTLAKVADAAFPADLAALPQAFAWAGAFCYALQIFYDFSGYSDMAIGLGRVFGFRFPENFDHPYGSTSVREFWRRWHMTLSGWFRDYLYIPLGGSRRGAARTYLNLVLVFALCGLWHGASWCFVLWGLWHGLGLVGERLLARRAPSRQPLRLALHARGLGAVQGGDGGLRSGLRRALPQDPSPRQPGPSARVLLAGDGELHALRPPHGAGGPAPLLPRPGRAPDAPRPHLARLRGLLRALPRGLRLRDDLELLPLHLLPVLGRPGRSGAAWAARMSSGVNSAGQEVCQTCVTS